MQTKQKGVKFQTLAWERRNSDRNDERDPVTVSDCGRFRIELVVNTRSREFINEIGDNPDFLKCAHHVWINER